jgi:hypothetical protein
MWNRPPRLNIFASEQRIFKTQINRSVSDMLWYVSVKRNVTRIYHCFSLNSAVFLFKVPRKSFGWNNSLCLLWFVVVHRYENCPVITIPVERSVTPPHYSSQYLHLPLPTFWSRSHWQPDKSPATSRHSSAALHSSSCVSGCVLLVTRSQQECFHVGTELCVTFNDFWQSPLYFLVH